LEGVTPGPIGRSIAAVVAVADEDADALRLRRANEVAGERGLADASFAAKEDEASLAGDGRREFVAQAGLLPGPAGEDGRRESGG
jgi:hypothetical protein